MEIHYPKSINKFFWSLFPIVFVIVGYYDIVIKWKLPHYGFNELEDFGSLLFVLVISACESAIIVALILWLISFLKKLFNKLDL